MLNQIMQFTIEQVRTIKKKNKKQSSLALIKEESKFEEEESDGEIERFNSESQMELMDAMRTQKPQGQRQSTKKEEEFEFSDSDDSFDAERMEYT